MRARSRQRKPGPEGRGFFTRERTLIALGIALGAFVIGYGVTSLAFISGRDHSEVVTVPDVRETQFTDATRILARAGLEGIVSDSFPNPNIEAGAVIAQTPLPGQEVGPGAQVNIIVSSGPQRPEVPDVSTMALALATRALQTAGFEVLVEDAEPGDGPRGQIVEVVPAPGTALALPTTVRLRIGVGLGDFPMPLLVGMGEAAARDTLAALDLVLAEVVYDAGDDTPPLEVMAQDPVPGDTVSEGRSVRLRLRSLDDGRFTRPGFDEPLPEEGREPREEEFVPLGEEVNPRGRRPGTQSQGTGR